MDVPSADVPAAVVPPAYVQSDDKEAPAPAPHASGVRKRNAESSAGVKSSGGDAKSYTSRATGAVAESAERQVRGVAAVASDAVTSGAWAYPLRGALYILSRECGRHWRHGRETELPC